MLGHKQALHRVGGHIHVHGCEPFLNDLRRFAGPAVGAERGAHAVQGAEALHVGQHVGDAGQYVVVVRGGTHDDRAAVGEFGHHVAGCR